MYANNFKNLEQLINNNIYDESYLVNKEDDPIIVIQKNLDQINQQKKNNENDQQFDLFLTFLVDDLSQKIITFYQPNMCWAQSDEQEEIIKNRYLMTYKDGKKDEGIEDISLRMQRTISSQLTLYTSNIELIKKFEKLINYLFINRLFILNTPQIFNLGNGLSKSNFEIKSENMKIEDYLFIFNNINKEDFTTAQCFILDLEDSMEGIFETLKKQALIQKAQGGIGFNIGKLRPKNQYIKSSDSSSSGCLSFLHIFNETGKVVKQGNKRRWQGMQVLSDIYDKFWIKPCSFHPDTFDFINQKKQNTGDSILQNFNISLGILNSKDLINKYNTDEDIKFTFEGKLIKDIVHKDFVDKVIPGISQKQMLNTIQENQHKSGDPGLLFLDKINKYNPLRDYELYMISCNPCFTGDMKILTYDGYKSFESLDGKEISIINKDGMVSFSKINYSGEKEVIKIQSTNNQDIKCTSNHKFMLFDGTICKAKDLLNKQLMPFNLIGSADKPIIVRKITDVGIAKVYDFTEPLTNWGIVENVVVHNCGERPGISSYKYKMYDTCDLGHIDLTKLLIKHGTKNVIDASMLYSLSVVGSYILDLLHDLLMYPVDEVKKGVLSLRSIGMGFYGLQGILMLMGVPYDSQEQRGIQSFIMKVMETGQSNMSFLLQKSLYPYLMQKHQNKEISTQFIWEDELNYPEIYNKYQTLEKTKIQEYFKYNHDGSSSNPKRFNILNTYEEFNDLYLLIKKLYKNGQKRRNINLTTIQPTGTTSIIGQTKILGDVGSGIEPLYSLLYKRYITNSDGTKTEQLYNSKLLLRIIDPINYDFLINLKNENIDFQKMLSKETLNNYDQSVKQLNWMFVNSDLDKTLLNPLFMVLKQWIEKHYTSMEINYLDHIQIQEQVQMQCSSQISKTINMKNDQKIKDVLDSYLYQLNSEFIKGITIYRDGSLQTQVLETQNEQLKKKLDLPDKLNFLKFNIEIDTKTGRIKPREKPIIMESLKKTIIHKEENKTDKKFHIEVGFTENNEPFEVFVRTTESSQDYTSLQNLYGRLVSTQFRSGLDITEVLHQQKKVKNWKNDYEQVLVFISNQIEDLIQLSKKSLRQKKQIIEDINVSQSQTQKKQIFEPKCQVCNE